MYMYLFPNCCFFTKLVFETFVFLLLLKLFCSFIWNLNTIICFILEEVRTFSYRILDNLVMPYVCCLFWWFVQGQLNFVGRGFSIFFFCCCVFIPIFDLWDYDTPKKIPSSLQWPKDSFVLGGGRNRVISYGYMSLQIGWWICSFVGCVAYSLLLLCFNLVISTKTLYFTFQFLFYFDT